MPQSDLEDVTRFKNFFENRVMPRIIAEMGDDCQGFFDYLGDQDPELYNRIDAAFDEISSLWHPEADRQAFYAACRTWHDLLMEGKKGFEAWSAREQERAAQVGKQEAMRL